MSGFGSRTPELPNQHLSKAYIHPIDFVAHDSLLLAPDVDSRLSWGDDFCVFLQHPAAGSYIGGVVFAPGSRSSWIHRSGMSRLSHTRRLGFG
jgi:hypothetical protein